MLNGGYIVRATLIDTHFNLLQELIENGYLEKSRSQLLQMRFRIKWGSGSPPTPEKSTEYQTVNVIGMRSWGNKANKGYLEFIGIDPPSWYLNTGDGSGRAYTGNIKSVIEQVVAEYAPDIDLEVSETTDSTYNTWYMMRQDPKSFINSMLDWSSPITKNKTHWLIVVDGNRLEVKEQAAIPSTPRAYYRFWDGRANDTIIRWELLSNNALSIAETKLVTQGLSTISGQYLDRITDEGESIVYAKDTNTPHKKIADTKEHQSFTKPNDANKAGPQRVGWTSMPSMPEIYSAGEIGLNYDQYVDGNARGMFLNLTNNLMRMKLTVIGHGEWSSCKGLGTDTVFIKWMSRDRDDGAGKKLWFLSGNWLIYGFHHKVMHGEWRTDLYLSRYDYNAVANKVGGSIIM